MENGPHEEAEFPKDEEVDDDEVPSATSRSETLEEEDEDEEPLLKRQKRKSGESASALSPAKQVEVENVDEASESSSGARRTSDLAEPVVASPRGFAAPTGFARMPSVSLGSEDNLDVTRLVLQPSPCFVACTFLTLRVLELSYLVAVAVLALLVLRLQKWSTLLLPCLSKVRRRPKSRRRVALGP